MAHFCLVCTLSFESASHTAKYCSRICKGIASRKPSNSFCGVCTAPLGKNASKFCSSACFQLSRVSQILSGWLEGMDAASNRDGTLSDAARSYLIKEAHEKCTRCGWHEKNPVLNRPILTIDHIDGNWRNNLRVNLVVLCFNCHTLTETFGSLNRGTISPKSNYTRKNHTL
jgi:hypothetical protein